MKTYFATDGSFGDAEGIVIVDTSLWDEDDWDVMGSLSDDNRYSIAKTIADAQEWSNNVR